MDVDMDMDIDMVMDNEIDTLGGMACEENCLLS